MEKNVLCEKGDEITRIDGNHLILLTVLMAQCHTWMRFYTLQYITAFGFLIGRQILQVFIHEKYDYEKSPDGYIKNYSHNLSFSSYSRTQYDLPQYTWC